MMTKTNPNKQKMSRHDSIRIVFIILGIFFIVSGQIASFYPAFAGEFPTPKQGEEKEPALEEPKAEEQEELPPVEEQKGKGGCLIATATYGTELAPQVQQLREIRENVLMTTGSGTAFLSMFNDVYYSFSPTLADWERQNFVFKKLVKTAIMPMLSTLLILDYVEIDSEQEMLGYGIGIILLNIGMYFVAPAFAVLGLRKLARAAFSKKVMTQ